MRLFIENFLLVFIALIPIVNPLGGAAVFIAITRGLTPSGRIFLSRKVAINAFLLLAASLFVGNLVLIFFGLSVPVIQIGGGLIVCNLAWSLLKQDSMSDLGNTGPEHELNPNKNGTVQAFYPLTLPLTIGPGSISVAITLGANHANSVHSWFAAAPSFIVGAAAVAASIYLCFRYAYQITKLLGATGTLVFTRLFAFILLCIGIQIIWNGASVLLAQVCPIPVVAR